MDETTKPMVAIVDMGIALATLMSSASVSSPRAVRRVPPWEAPSMHTPSPATSPPEDGAERPNASYQDVLDAPPHLVAEIINGTLHTHPRPAAPHARAASALGGKLGTPFDYDAGGPGGWWIIDEPELHLTEEVLVPDLAGWRRERMPEFPTTAYFTLAPDWVCEALSPSTSKVDRLEKRPAYARRRRPPVAHRPARPHPRGLRTPRRPVAADCEREGRRSGKHPPFRCDNVQPGGPVDELSHDRRNDTGELATKADILKVAIGITTVALTSTLIPGALTEHPVQAGAALLTEAFERQHIGTVGADRGEKPVPFAGRVVLGARRHVRRQVPGRVAAVDPDHDRPLGQWQPGAVRRAILDPGYSLLAKRFLHARGDTLEVVAHRLRIERAPHGKDVPEQLHRDAARHERGPLRLQVQHLGRDEFGEQHRQRTEAAAGRTLAATGLQSRTGHRHVAERRTVLKRGSALAP